MVERPAQGVGRRFTSAKPIDAWEVAARAFEVTGAVRYLDDPVGFCRDCIAWPRDQQLVWYQSDILNELIAHRRLAVRGPHGLGKTTTAALAVLWFAITRDAAKIDWKVITTSGAWHQLTAYLWPEIHKWNLRLRWDVLEIDPWRPEREILAMGIRLRHGAASAASPTRSELIEGAHADHLLFVYDESKAIPNGIFDASEGALNGPGTALALMQSTPGPPQGRFFEVHSKKPGLEDWKTKHVTRAHVEAAGRMSPDWANQRERQWGRDSAIFKNRVEGEFFESESDATIPLSWIEAAQERWQEWNLHRTEPEGHNVFGVDVARGGEDLTAVAHRIGPVVKKLVTWNLSDTTKVAIRVRRMMSHPGVDLAVVDTIGVGAGVVDMMRRFKPPLHVVAFNASRKTKRRDRIGDFGFKNQRAAMWWNMRESLDPSFDPVLCLPPDEELAAEMSAPRWREIGGKIQIESKQDIRDRLGRSTDRADAVCQTLLTDAEFDERKADPDDDGIFAYTDGSEVDGIFSWGQP